MEKLYKIREKLCKELDEIGRKGDLSAGDLETLHKLTDTIKNIDKIEMYESGGYSSDDGYSRDGGYSQKGNWEAKMHGEYGNSYANRGQHYVRGHYSREGGSSMSDGHSMAGGYSGESKKSEFIAEMMQDARNDREREMIKRMAQMM